MPKYKDDKIDKIEKAMFQGELQSLTPNELELKTRLESIFTHWLDKPWLSDNQIRTYIENQYGFDKSKANREMYFVKQLLGNVKNAAKEWHRYAVIEMLKKAYNLAVSEGDTQGMIAAADKIGKYTKLDKPDEEELPFDQVFVPEFDFTTDVSVIGIKPVEDPEALKSKLRKKYLGDVDDAEIV